MPRVNQSGGLAPGTQANAQSTLVVNPADIPTPVAVVPTLTPAVAEQPVAPPDGSISLNSDMLEQLYNKTHPGVVSIIVSIQRNGVSGAAAGSGFIIDNDGHIVTNNHVVADAQLVVVIFSTGVQREAQIIGTDDDSDLAVIKVDQLPEGTHPISLGDSASVVPGQYVVAIGNPFGMDSTMTSGIVSAIGRAIPSGVTPFSIPQSIQTDAAINPGNSGGPLLNLQGEVIGVNAQISTGGQVQANAGVGFAIPSNIVRMVAPSLIDEGAYTWPWLGVRGDSVSLFIQKANNLASQNGAYIDSIVEGGPAAAAGLQGSQSTTDVDGITTPVGGDVVVSANGKAILNFNDLLSDIAVSHPGDTMDLTVIRNGQKMDVQVTLAARPATFQTQP